MHPSAQETSIMLMRQRRRLEEIMEEAREFKDDIRFSANVDRWKDETVTLLKQHWNESQAKKLEELYPITNYLDTPMTNTMLVAETYYQHIEALEMSIEQSEDAYLLESGRLLPSKQNRIISKDKLKVFIAHGHDETNALKLQKMLREKWNCEAWFLADKPMSGRTIIEKFEEEADPANYAFVLLTADDLVIKQEEIYPQPRPNPIFELGWLYKHLGRERVCILLTEGTNLPSDLGGIGHISFDQDVRDKSLEIEKEIMTITSEKKGA